MIHSFPPVGETVFLRGRPVTVIEVRAGRDLPGIVGMSDEKLRNSEFELVPAALLRVRGANTSPKCDEFVRFEETTGWL
ncbi:MAG: hypothetical protein KJ077_11305 [Anaerolineae bacterium]|nr:hypothetical protein [Anaerolineae bacterium]